MKKLNKILALVLAFVMVAALLAGCGPKINVGGDTTNGNNPSPSGNNNQTDPVDPDNTVYTKYTKGKVTLRMAFGYNSKTAAISFNSDIINDYGDGQVFTLNGKTYRAGDLKPTWQELENRLGIEFIDVYQGNKPGPEYTYWSDKLEQVEVLYGDLSTLNKAGQNGALVNLTDYLNMMPNFKAYLDANPIVRLSIVADPDKGDIYFSPYFDGADDIERMPLMRTDWVEKLLNGEGEFTASASNKTAAPVYTPYMPTSGTIDIETVKADGTGTFTLTKDYSKYGNIIEKMNAAGSIDGVTAVNMLREYIDKTYGGYYTPDHRADLFIGQDAAWDADELVALLRCVVANPQTLNGTNKVNGLFARENSNLSRKVDMYRFAGILFGVRGLESRQDFLYVDKDGKLHDARQEVATYEAMDRMYAMTQEGLISESYVKNEDVKTKDMLEKDLGFMHYDYNQTQTLYNEDGSTLDVAAGEKYMAVMIPVARWNDGTGEQYFRFTESWRSVKDSGIAIPKAAVADNEEELYAALALIDYAFSKEGQILMSYGPDEFIKHDANGNMVMFDFNGEQWPEIADSTREALWAMPKTPGNYTNFARYYLGSTLNFLKSQSFEYQCTSDVGREGAGHLSTAIALGVIKHPELDITDNMWYTIIPTTLPLDQSSIDAINRFTYLSGDGSLFGTSSSNELVEIISFGYSSDKLVGGISSAAAAADQAVNEFSGKGYLVFMQDAFDLAVEKYNG